MEGGRDPGHRDRVSAAGGGIGRAYYIGVEAESSHTPTKNVALCLVPQGTEEGQKLELQQTFILRLATPVALIRFEIASRPSSAQPQPDSLEAPSVKECMRT